MSMSLDLRSVMSALENASDLELLQLRTAIAHLLENPKRILAIRQRLNTGMPVEYWSLRDRRTHRGRIAHFKPEQVLIHRDDGGHVWVEYAALVIEGHQGVPEPASRPMLTREAFRLGDTVGFEGRDLLQHIGTIVRLNQKTATIACQEGEWRVSYSLLHRIVDV
jgi:hypothetical protein